MVGQALEAAQIAQHHFASHIGADAHQFEIHNRAHLAVFKRHRRRHLRALFFIAGFQRFIHHFVRQIGGQFGQFVGIQIIHRGQQFLLIHGFNQGFAHRVRHFQQHFAVFFGRGQMPHQRALFLRQRFEQAGHVGRVQFVQNGNQLNQLGIELAIFHRQIGVDLLGHGQQRFGQLVDAFDIERQAVDIALGNRFCLGAHKYSARLIAGAISGGIRRRGRVWMKSVRLMNWEGP